jgi:hypothetical protein
MVVVVLVWIARAPALAVAAVFGVNGRALNMVNRRV